MIAVAQAAAEKRPPRFPLTLNTGRVRDQWHTMTRTGRAARLGQHIAEPFAEIHPEDAAARGIAAADLVEVTSPHGRALVRALVTDRVRPGSVFVPMHWSGAFASARPRRRPGARRDRPALRPARAQGGLGRGPPPRRRLVRLRRQPPAAGARHRLLGDRPDPLRLARGARRRGAARRLGRLRPGDLRRPGGRDRPLRGPRPRHGADRARRGRPRHRRPLRRAPSRSRSPAPTSSRPSRPTPRRACWPAAPAPRRRTAAPSSAPASTSASTPSSTPSPAAR